YQLEISGPRTHPLPGGPVTASGYITIAQLGALAPANFIDWSIAFSSPNKADTLLTPANSQVFITGGLTPASVFANSAGIYVEFPDWPTIAAFQIGANDEVFPLHSLISFESYNLSQEGPSINI